MSTKAKVQARFGIGEWYGKSFARMTPSERRSFIGLRDALCPFQSTEQLEVKCTKQGGVCSIRLYQRDDTGNVQVVDGPQGSIRTTCPNRFKEDNVIFQWVGETLLGRNDPLIIKEVPYLSPVRTEGHEIGFHNDDAPETSVGNIDFVLVDPDVPSNWCALEIQAVYFSGGSISKDYTAIRTTEHGIPFPAANRRPDYRSSGPKRLMPQLQIKVPSLRRWGKKLAVVIDKAFWASLGRMEKVDHVSNCDIAWFVVDYQDDYGESIRLRRFRVYLTTLEQAIEGLTAGKPVSIDAFQERLQRKVQELTHAP